MRKSVKPVEVKQKKPAKTQVLKPVAVNVYNLY